MSPSAKSTNNQNKSSNKNNLKGVQKGNSNKNNMAFRGNPNRNRNFGGNNYGGGPMGGGNRGMGGGGGGMNMSPWESQNSVSAFTNNLRQGGPGVNAQALNLANNLLNNLLRNQNPPSLLDLPRGGGGGMGGGNRNQRGGPMVNRGGIGNHHRPNNRRGPGGFQNRGPAGQKPVQKQQGGGGIRKQNAFDRAKKLLAKNANNANKKKETNNATSTSDDKKTAESTGTGNNAVRESPYDTVPNDMFYCHLCKKHMWDANSFENHIKGRTHLMMREGIEESYRLKANMIRQEAKIAEQLKSIEFDRLKRMGKSKQRQLDYCTMCDLNFHGHISTHRKSDGHLQLKKFLHPKCIECNNEFATRIDYDTHLLSADHLKKAAEKNVKVGEHKRQTLPISTEEEETRDLRPPQKRRKRPAKKDNSDASGTEIKKEAGTEGEEAETAAGDGDETKESEEGAAVGDETKEGDDLMETQEGGVEGDEEEVALPVDPEDVILDYEEGDEIPSEIDARLPKYNWLRAVGTGLITKLECHECSICGKYFDTEKTVEVHSRTASHHRNFLKFINEKSSDTKITQKRAAAALEASERKKIKLDEEANDGAADGEEKEELYDPSEATADDEEGGEGAENGDEAEMEGDGENGEEGGMEVQEEEELEPEPEVEKEPVPEPQPTPVKVAPKQEPVKATPAKVATPAVNTPVAAIQTTPTNQSTDSPPAKKPTPTGPRGGGRATPARNRGRGRYNRY